MKSCLSKKVVIYVTRFISDSRQEIKLTRMNIKLKLVTHICMSLIKGEPNTHVLDESEVMMGRSGSMERSL